MNSNNDQQIFQHMRRYYAHVFNGVNKKYSLSFIENIFINFVLLFKVNQKYQNSLENDPDLRINIVLVHIMIMTVSAAFFKKLFLTKNVIIMLFY